MRMTTLVVCICLAVLGVAAEATTSDDSAVLSRPIGQLDLSGKTLMQVASCLARSSHLLLAVESLDPEQTLICNLPEGSCQKRINLSLDPNTSLASALDATVAQDPRYKWWATNGWLHIYPRDRTMNYILDSLVTVHFQPDSGWVEQLSEVMGGLPQGWKRQVTLAYGRGRDRNELPLPTTAVPMREAVDIVLWRAGANGWMTRPAVDSNGKITGAVLEILF